MEEKELFESNMQNRAKDVLSHANYDRPGKRYSKFKEEFRDVFEDRS